MAALGVLWSFAASMADARVLRVAETDVRATIALVAACGVLAIAGLLLRPRRVLSHLAIAALGLACALAIVEPAFVDSAQEAEQLDEFVD